MGCSSLGFKAAALEALLTKERKEAIARNSGHATVIAAYAVGVIVGGFIGSVVLKPLSDDLFMNILTGAGYGWVLPTMYATLSQDRVEEFVGRRLGITTKRCCLISREP